MDAADRDYVFQQYSTDEGLKIRIETHQRYGIGTGEIFATMTGIMMEHRPQPDRILDVGAGNGNWYRAIRSEVGWDPAYTAADQSDGMVDRLRELLSGDTRADAMWGDAQSLPFDDAQFDWVGAHFMLYHVPDIQTALNEGWRVLKPGGILAAAANGEHPYRELWDVAEEAVHHLGFPGIAEKISDRFNLSNGAGFFPVPPRLFSWPGGFRFPAAEPALRYLASGPLRFHLDSAADDAATAQRALELIRSRIEDVIKVKGVFEVHSQSGFFLAQKA